MADPSFAKQEAGLAPELTRAFADSKNDDPRVRQYLALTLGRLTPPLARDTRRLLIEALDDPDSQTRINAMWALGATGDVAAARDIARQFGSDDPGVRKMAVYALGSLPVETGNDTLVKALEDESPTCSGTPPSRWRAMAGTRVYRCSGACSTARTSSAT